MMRQRIQQSQESIAELVAKLQEEQAKLDRLEARVEKYEEAIAFLQEAIAEDPLLWGEVRDRLRPAWLGNSEGPKDELQAASPAQTQAAFTAIEKDILSVLETSDRWLTEKQILERCSDVSAWEFSDGIGEALANLEKLNLIVANERRYSLHVPSGQNLQLQNPTSEHIFDAIALPPTIISDGNGSAKLGCAKQKLAKEWRDLVTLWGCTGEVTKAESFLDKEIKWEVAIANITRSQLETLAKTHTSPHAEVPTTGRKIEREPSSEQIFDAECLPPLDTTSTDGDKDLPSLILGHLESVGSSDFVELCQVKDLDSDDDEIAQTLESLKGQGLIFEISEDPWLWSVKAPAAVESTEPISVHPQSELAIAVTVDEVLDGASPLNLSAAQISDLEDALVGAPPSIDDIAEEKPSAYAEDMAARIKVGTKLKSLPCPGDVKHKYSKKRTGIVRRIEQIGANYYAFVVEFSEAGNNSRQTAYYNVEAVEIVEEAPVVELAIGVTEEPVAQNGFDHFEPFDPIEVALQADDGLGGLEAEIFQFLTEKAAQSDLYEGNDPIASLSEIGDAIKLESPDWDRLHTALDNLEARGSILHRGDRWQIAKEEHSFNVGDRVTICGDSKGEDLIGKTGTLTAVSLMGCVLILDGEDEKSRLFFCKEDLIPCSTSL